MSIGTCNACGGELDDNSLQFALETGAGNYRPGYVAAVPHRLDRFDVCGACLAGERAASTILTKMIDDPYAHGAKPPSKRCTIACMRPRHRTPILLGRRRIAEFEDAYCPVCFGPADVTEATGAQPVHRRLRDRLRGRMPAREPWTGRMISEE
jgi:hypothetical protein